MGEASGIVESSPFIYRYASEANLSEIPATFIKHLLE